MEDFERICQAEYQAVRRFLLRLSVHDPVMPLNAESDVPGGVKFVLGKLYEVLSQCEGIDLSPLASALEA